MHHLEMPTRRAIMATLVSASSVDGGPTDEQRRFLDVLAEHVLVITDEPGTLDPAGAAAAIVDEGHRRAVVEGLITLELMAHPADPALVAHVAEYIDALGGAEEQVLARDYVTDAREQVALDWQRLSEPSRTAESLPEDEPTEIARRLDALAACAPGSLGRSFHDFYQRNGFPWPDHLSLVGHDFAHVLAGYEATPEGELALQAMLVASTSGTRHFSGLLASLLLFEVGMLPFNDIEPKTAVLDRPGAAELFADAIVRGVAVGSDFQDLDHLALADRPVVELRDELHIPPPVVGPFTFAV